MTNVNYLGTYDSLSALWMSYPEGGQEGDYVTISNSQYSWNKYTRQWVLSSSDDSGIMSASIQGNSDIHFLGSFASVDDVLEFYPDGGSEHDYIVVEGVIYNWDDSKRTWIENLNHDITLSVLQNTSSEGRINYLGSFNTLGNVWSAIPEGGYEGDYVHINASINVWNKWIRNWGNNVDPGTPAITNQTVDGDLTVLHNLIVAGYIYGTAENAEEWDGHAWDDYMDQRLRTTDNVSFGEVSADSFVVPGEDGFLKADGSIDVNEYATIDYLEEALLGYATQFSISGDNFNLCSGDSILSSISKEAFRSFIGTRESGSDGNFLYSLGDVYGNVTSGSVRRADGSPAVNNDALVFNSTLGKWVADVPEFGVTSVGLHFESRMGMSVGSSPIKSSGTLEVYLDNAREIPVSATLIKNNSMPDQPRKIVAVYGSYPQEEENNTLYLLLDEE